MDSVNEPTDQSLWHGVANIIAKNRDKLHVAVKKANGGYHSECNRQLILKDDCYPSSMLSKAREDGRLCKRCMNKVRREASDAEAHYRP